MPQPRPGLSPPGGHCPVGLPSKPPDSAETWHRAWPQTQRELEALVDAYLDRLVRYAYSRLGNIQDAEDVVQEVFVRCLSDRSQRQDVGMVGPYLYRSVANACTDMVRKRTSGVVARNDAGVESAPARNGNPSEAIELADELRRADMLLKELPPAQAEIVRLRVFDGLRLNEIADVVGCSVNTVSSRLRYGFRKLRHLVLKQKGVAP